LQILDIPHGLPNHSQIALLAQGLFTRARSRADIATTSSSICGMLEKKVM